jgi:hypothetical protein
MMYYPLEMRRGADCREMRIELGVERVGIACLVFYGCIGNGVDGIYCLMGVRLEYILERGTHITDFVLVFSVAR